MLCEAGGGSSLEPEGGKSLGAGGKSWGPWAGGGNRVPGIKYSLGPRGPKGLKGACPGKNSRGSRGRSRFPGGIPGAYSLKPSGGRKTGPKGGGSGRGPKGPQS